MSLLPAAFRQSDIPLTLGKKITPSVSKIADPTVAFETGNHHPDGTVGFASECDLHEAWRSVAAHLMNRSPLNVDGPFVWTLM